MVRYLAQGSRPPGTTGTDDYFRLDTPGLYSVEAGLEASFRIDGARANLSRAVQYRGKNQTKEQVSLLGGYGFSMTAVSTLILREKHLSVL